MDRNFLFHIKITLLTWTILIFSLYLFMTFLIFIHQKIPSENTLAQNFDTKILIQTNLCLQILIKRKNELLFDDWNNSKSHLYNYFFRFINDFCSMFFKNSKCLIASSSNFRYFPNTYFDFFSDTTVPCYEFAFRFWLDPTKLWRLEEIARL